MAEAAVGVLQGQSSSKELNALNSTQSNDRESAGVKDCLALKARKPYTVTKQRERWSEEDHKKFLEALQLHGRAWRRIEEHIGTKTAVQIRSHAQKFFSKVARDANDNGAGEAKQIEIPPPRPKKKPLHPYPRKIALSTTKEIPALGKSESPSSPLTPISELEHRSPTSVLTAVGPELIDRFFFNNRNGYGSGITSPATSGDEIDGRLSLGLASAALATQYNRAMEFDASSSEHHIYPEEAAPAPTLKLFGRTVVVGDSRKQPPQISGDVADISSPEAISSPEDISESTFYGMELDSGKPSEYPIEAGFPAHGMLPFLPTFYSWPASYGDAVNLTCEAKLVPLPWIPLYGGIPFPYSYPQQHIVQPSAPNECSPTCPNTAYAEHPTEEKKSVFTPFFKRREIGEGGVTGGTCTRGFVPYRRCAWEGKVERAHVAGDSVGDNPKGLELFL